MNQPSSSTPSVRPTDAQVELLAWRVVHGSGITKDEKQFIFDTLMATRVSEIPAISDSVLVEAYMVSKSHIGGLRAVYALNNAAPQVLGAASFLAETPASPAVAAPSDYLEAMPTDAVVRAICDWMAWPYAEPSMRRDASDLYRAIENAAPQAVAQSVRASGKSAEAEDTEGRGFESHQPAGAAPSDKSLPTQRTVKRFREVCSTYGGGRMLEKETGEWVSFDDYHQLERELAMVRHDLERAMANHNADLNAPVSAIRPSPSTLWMVFFEDKSVPPTVFFGEGAETGARAHYENAKDHWSCHLLVRVPTGPGEQCVSTDSTGDQDGK